MMKEIDVCYIKLFLRIDLEKCNRSLLRDGNFQFRGEFGSNCKCINIFSVVNGRKYEYKIAHF